jgi:VanZ family protein
MWWHLFTAHSLHKKRAKFIAIIWTLLIFIACFIPGNEIPNINVPFADKWIHFILFGGFSFLWLLAFPEKSIGFLLFIFLLGCVFGWMVEELQGLLYFLGRAKDWLDIYADAFGSFIGTFIFLIASKIAYSKK